MTFAAGLVLVLLCVVAEGFFSGSEMALVNADRLRLIARAKEGHGAARLALELLEREDRLLATCLIGTNLCTISGATLMSMLLLHQWQRNDEWLVALCFVPLTLVLGEALPKTVYHHHADQIALWVARPLAFFQRVFALPVAMASGWGHVLSRVVGAGERSPVTRQDILHLLDDPAPGSIDPEEHQIIRKVFEFTETPVEDCMTPLVEVDAISARATLDDAVTLSVRGSHSRLPVFRDRIDNIVGIIHATDLLFGAEGHTLVEEAMHPATFVPESKRVDELLKEMRREGLHFAVVVDEYGGSVGIVTVEDLVEEIIGEIRDERDEDEPGIREMARGEWRVPARVEVEDLEEATGIRLPRGDYETVAGLILAACGRIPEAGEVVKVGRLAFRIDGASDRAIVLVHLTIPPDLQEG